MRIVQIIRAYPIIIYFFVALASWALFHSHALSSAFNIWYLSEIYTHGLFILPICAYLLYRSRHNLLITPRQSALLPVIALLLLTLLGVAAYIGRLGVIEHISAFTTLPLIIIAFVGYRAAKSIWFPLLFCLFAIPIGDQLVPQLQDITADIAVWMLKLTGIPVLRSGLYIEIPEGKFVVAEACSGIRFFIGSIVFGVVYAYVSFISWPRRLAFVTLSIVIPIFANALRVYGIILVGHLSDMKHAAGADHLVYGWVFFSLVIVLLVFVGETFSQHQKPHNISAKELHSSWKQAKFRGAHLMIPAVFFVSMAWKTSIDFNSTHIRQDISAHFENSPSSNENNSIATPVMKGAAATYFGNIDNVAPLVFIAQYGSDSMESELISGGNRLFDIDRWSLVNKSSFPIEMKNDELNASKLEIVSSWDAKQNVIYWYQSKNWATGKERVAKIRQIADRLLGGSGDGSLIAVIYFDEEPSQSELNTVYRFVETHLYDGSNKKTLNP